MFNTSFRFRILLILVVFNCNLLSAQDWGRYWCFGDSAGIDFSNPAMPVLSSSLMDCSSSCASIGDSANGLLMYEHIEYWPLFISGHEANTVIHNSSHNIMINADTLIGDFFDGLTFIPKPASDSVFYLFQWGFNPNDGLYYSIVEPFSNNNTGRVLQKNIPLLIDSTLQGGVHAIKHGNGRDWWIITRNGPQSNRFNLFLVTPDSILGPFVQNIGSITSTDAGNIAISKQGDKIAIVNYLGILETYSFDRCSGQISNPVTIINQNLPYHYFGCEFSPDGNLLYVSNSDNIFGGDSLRLYQFDLTNSNPASTLQKIYCEPVPASGGGLKRGPDDKIYFTCLYKDGWPYTDTSRSMYNENLSVINSPNTPGLGCNFTPFSFYLGGNRTYWGLPNNPNYTLGPLVGSVCDSLFTNVSNIEKADPVTIYPNPCSNILNIICNLNNEKSIKLFSSDFQLVYCTELKNNFSTIDLSDFDNGIYFLKIGSDYYKKIIILK